jgi:copper chaperone
MTTTTFLVTGMTCQHCINAVTTEISGVPAVTGVRVDLESGNVTVESDGVLEAEPILEAIVVAGYSGRAV